MARTALSLALVACLAACASAALPESFNTTGAPPVVAGAGGLYITNATDGTFSYTGWVNGANMRLTTGAGTDQFTTVEGVYQSWQCTTDFPGAYNALVSLTTTAADGTKTQKTVCELGVYSGLGYLDIAQSESECPTMPEFSIVILNPPAADFPCAAIDTLPTDIGLSPEMPDMMAPAPAP